ncbi:2-deoxyribose-5-phosphate aldolase [Corynebacterium hansenii]|uniref:2-deoxyribose-5-phosphate aldolase n=1 Tax=Corynebacterium hansenii TaxID=394964 RepID=A0ABV7ZME8_9CORY|nr:2-deoxyribose-5-phosphate aldolase [Corynebacterium hansenii]WJY98908.1 Deoxyribose-phosphate aldolase [Corynebacterium hansenii]
MSQQLPPTPRIPARHAAKTDVAVLDPELPAAVVRSAVAAAAGAGCAGVRLLPAMLDQLGEGGAGRLRLGAVCGFPTGRSHVLVKAAEARLAAEHGAHDVAVVVDRAAVAAGDANAVLSEVVALRGAVAAPTQLTIVVEAGLHASGVLDDDTFDAIIGAIAAGGADAVATSTGWARPGGGGAAAAAGAEQILRIRAAAPGLGIIAVVHGEAVDVKTVDGEAGEASASSSDRAGELLAAGAHVVQAEYEPQ